MRWKLPDSRGLRFSLIAGALVALLALDGAYAALRFRAAFKSAACNLKRATDRIEELDLDKGIMRLEQAEDSVSAARGYLGHPPVGLAVYLPRIGGDVRVLKALTGVAREAVAAGLEGARAAEAMGLAGEGSLSAIYDDGKVRFDTLERASKAMAAGLEHLTAASNIIAGSPTPRIGQVRSAFFGANRLVQDATAQLSDGLDVLDALPGILGARGLRRYFLAFQTPSEASKEPLDEGERE